MTIKSTSVGICRKNQSNTIFFNYLARLGSIWCRLSILWFSWNNKIWLSSDHSSHNPLIRFCRTSLEQRWTPSWTGSTDHDTFGIGNFFLSCFFWFWKDTVIQILAIGLSNEHRLTAPDALEMADQLLRRCAAVHNQRLSMLEADNRRISSCLRIYLTLDWFQYFPHC